MREIYHLMNGKRVTGSLQNFADIDDPNPGKVHLKVALGCESDMIRTDIL